MLLLPTPWQVLDDSSAALVAAAESQAYHQEVAASVEAAKAVAADAAAAAVAAGVDAAHVATAVLPPQGGASDVGLSLVRYAKEHAVDVMVLGNRGLGALRRAALSFVGLGSVTDYCAHNMHCPLAVVKAPPAPAPAAQEQQHGRAAARAHAHSS